MQIILEGLEGSGELWLDIMKIICGDTTNKSMLDLGCHKAPYTPLLGFPIRVYVDIQSRELDDPAERPYFYRSDVLEYLLDDPDRFDDVIIASDFIEHLTMKKGYALLYLMEIHSNKQILFTPLGDLSINQDGHPDSHATGWMPYNFYDYLTIVLPNFHPQLNAGAFFAVNCAIEEKQRIYNEIKIKYCFYDKN